MASAMQLPSAEVETSILAVLLSADTVREGATAALEAVAAVLHVLVTRADAELRRHALALRSADAVLDGMAHQMSNPLTGASAIAQLLAEDLRDDAHRAAVDQIRQELARAFAVL